MFLTDEALAQLTGLQRPSAMCRWLEREGIPFVVAADGKPRVLHAVIMGRLGGQVVRLQSNTKQSRRCARAQCRRYAIRQYWTGYSRAVARLLLLRVHFCMQPRRQEHHLGWN